MKFTIFSVLATFLVAVQANTTFYSPERDVTCTGNEESGQISCEPGHIGDAPIVELPKDDTSPAVKGRTPNPLDKRVTCNLDTVTQGLACFTHCFALNYCNSWCDGHNKCHCDCFDHSGVCVKTSCS